MDDKKIAYIIDEITAIYGKDSVRLLGDKEKVIARITTGLPELDAIIGGGIPCGRLVELYGVESSGKTSLAMQIASNFEKVAYINMEDFIEDSRLQMFGIEKGKFIIHDNLKYGEDAYDVMIKYAQVGIPLIILDSVPNLIPKAIFEEKDPEKQSRADIARLNSRLLPRLIAPAEKSGTTIIFINQARDNLAGMMYGDPVSTMGGHMLKHLASLRIKMSRKQWVKVSDETMGQISKVIIKKSKVSPPYGNAELPFIFEHGFCRHEDMKKIMIEIRKNRKK
jgi:recombination protein RecA